VFTARYTPSPCIKHTFSLERVKVVPVRAVEEYWESRVIVLLVSGNIG
jgi:hypothetical protein